MSQPLKQVNRQVAVIVILTHTTDKARWKERQDMKYKNCLLQNMKQMAVHEIYYWLLRTFGIVTVNQRNGTSREIEFDEALQEAFTKFVQGRFLMS